MDKRYHSCGGEVFTEVLWNGLTEYTVQVDLFGDDTGSWDCPTCGEHIYQSELSEYPPERDNGDLAPRLLEALERSITALSYIADELKELDEYDDAAMMERQATENRAAIEAAREGKDG